MHRGDYAGKCFMQVFTQVTFMFRRSRSVPMYAFDGAGCMSNF